MHAVKFGQMQVVSRARCRPSPLPPPHSPPSQFPAAPLHWIYDQPKVKALTKEKGTIEFYPTSQCIIETGRPVSMAKEGLVRLHYSSCVNAKILAEPIRFVDCCTALRLLTGSDGLEADASRFMQEASEWTVSQRPFM